MISNEVNTRSLTLGATLATPTLTNEFRANYTRNESSHFNKLDNFGGAIPPPDSLLFPAPFASPHSSRFIFFSRDEELRLVSGAGSSSVRMDNGGSPLQRIFDCANKGPLDNLIHSLRRAVVCTIATKNVSSPTTPSIRITR